ncbi:MAG: FHA domain-containing protein [Gammaproteobacteria bacterium]|nr:FHA domain-containing protein [Gammaproteobacteria bacterium]MCW8840151.1 FHA domain-containing protein [Gammaproteobacteria bacterium]MCW8959470.1 FHA domain-containing protein [Gammaproteobacteria bacterium]MCW8971816.1 FHA domain-containing protein [Gammaproteobacteria bacterium]MCW8993987.1 FHA domain-containing protein [Gammaproteobacteria bacterium]
MSKLTLAFKGKVLKVYYIQPGELLIGSDPACQIHIDSLAIQPRHASISTAQHKSTLHDLSEAEFGTFVNDKKLEAEHLLKHDDEIRIGKHTLLFTTEPVDEQAEDYELPAGPEERGGSTSGSQAAPKHAWLQILNGVNVGKTISIHRNLTNLGKSGVQTAIISRRGDGYFLSHLEGERTPLVDGEEIGDNSRKLEDGNVIQIGNVRMQFSLS